MTRPNVEINEVSLTEFRSVIQIYDRINAYYTAEPWLSGLMETDALLDNQMFWIIKYSG